MELMKASHQWATRPDDERFLSLTDMQSHFHKLRQNSRSATAPSRSLSVMPDTDNKGLLLVGPAGNGFAPTNWAFGQLCQVADAPASYLSSIPAPVAADCINYGLRFKPTRPDVGVLLHKNGDSTLRAVTGPKYGRIWNSDVVDMMVGRFGDGVTGTWKVPGEFGEAVVVDKRNTTLYASDRNFFVFLADEQNRIEVPNRRGGRSGSLAKGFFVWNSEVGQQTLGIAKFLFDYVCCNRIVWGATEYDEIRIRHTSGAPERWFGEVVPMLQSYANQSDKQVVSQITDAQKDRIGDLDKFLASRFSKKIIDQMTNTHMIEEGRPIETRWDVVTAATAVARSVPHQDSRVALERKAGELLHLQD